MYRGLWGNLEIVENGVGKMCVSHPSFLSAALPCENSFATADFKKYLTKKPFN